MNSTDSINLILLVLAVVIVVMCGAVIYLSVNTYGQFKIKTFENVDPLYRIYVGFNTDVSVVTFRSYNDKLAIVDALYWAIRYGINKKISIDRIVYLDLDTNCIYRPNHGKFDCTNTLNIGYVKNNNNDIIEIDVSNTSKTVNMKFKYIDKI